MQNEDSRQFKPTTKINCDDCGEVIRAYHGKAFLYLDTSYNQQTSSLDQEPKSVCKMCHLLRQKVPF